MVDAIGFHYGRTDLERVGLFVDMGYFNNKGYTAPVTNVDVRDMKGTQMYPGVSKWKTGLQDCYFDQKFKRIFEKEAYTNRYIIEMNDLKEVKKKYPNMKPFIPSSSSKKHATPGDYHGTFGGIVKAFSPSLKPRIKEEKLPPNINTSPSKKGGPGFTDICINKFPVYKPSPFDDPKVLANDPKRKDDKLSTPFLGGSYPSYFDSNPYHSTKIQAATKKNLPKEEMKFGPFYPSAKNRTLDGCFSKWPAYQSSPYALPRQDKEAKKKTEPLFGPFRPQPHNKTMYTTSTLAHKVDIALNHQNWQTFKPVTYTHEGLV